MKLKNAIKKLNKNGFQVTKKTHNNYVAEKMSARHVVDFTVQDDEVIIIRVRIKEDKDDCVSDYFAGTFTDNIKRAIKLAS